MNNNIGQFNRQEVYRQLQDYKQHEDLFGSFILLIISKAPLAYTLINIILFIWIAQTLFNSKLNAIPNSIYLLSPLLAANPYSRLTLLPLTGDCPPGEHSVRLKSFPTINSVHINHQPILGWGADPVQFCSREIPQEKKSKSCQSGQVLCSGYCVKTSKECPITKLHITAKDAPIRQGFQQIYRTEDKSYRVSRTEGVPIVSIMVSYQPRCANDEHFNEVFKDQTEFWNQVINCGKEGTIDKFFTPIDTMETNTFFAINEIGITTTNSSMMEVTLGVVPEFHISNDAAEGCSSAYSEAENAKNYFGPTTTSFAMRDLFLFFIFFCLVVQLLWLFLYKFAAGYTAQMRLAAVPFAIGELVGVAANYSNNKEIFRLEGVTTILRKCLQETVPALKEWDLGVQSPQAFQTILFLNTAFLGIMLFSLAYDKWCLVTEHREQPVQLPVNSTIF